MAKIENKNQLLSNAYSPVSRKARRIVLDVIEKTLEAMDPERLIRSKVILADNVLKVNGEAFNLKAFRRIFVVGGGKASGSMAEALDEILGGRIDDGLVVVPEGTASRYKADHVKFHEASHPIPDESSVEGAVKILNLVSHPKKDELVICLISGGGSSLMTLPREGITLGDKQRMTDMLLRSGATINEMNTIRKHISSFKGGQLAKKAYPATLLSLLLSDVIGDPLDMIASGPTVPDSTTFNDAITILKTYSLWEEAPESIRRVLSDGAKGLIPETPKKDDPAFEKAHNIIIGNNRLACLAALDELKTLGLSTIFLTSFMEGEAKDLGSMLGALAREIVASGNPLPPPVGIVAGGETTVTVKGNGVGGRNQEVSLGAALKIEGLERVVIASISTDGVDGPTDAAGAIVDGQTILRSQALGLDARGHLRNNDSYSFFLKIGDPVCTGPTGTNVNDIIILLIL
jgi:glycerate 2-kinase